MKETRRKKTEEVLYETIPNPVITFDKNNKLVDCNQKFLDTMGFSKDEIFGMRAPDFLFEKDKKTYRDVIQPSLAKGKPLIDIDLHVKKKDGGAFHALWSHIRILGDNNEYLGFTAIGLDLTEIDKLRDELIKKEKAEIQLELEHAQEMDKIKEEFVAMITHDLKQPLVPIQGHIDLLKLPEIGELNDMQKESVDEITANVSLQLSMIDNLISAQKLGAGAMKYDIEELSSKDLLNACIKIHSPIMHDKNIEYFDSSTVDIKIKGDRKRILESFTNLIQNAHDFVPENGRIEIGVNDGDKEVTFFVKDNGEGIPKEKQDKLFKKYGQVESVAKRKFGGTGLGLAVSQELVEGMGGKIWFDSDTEKGTTFFFTLPKAD